MRSRNRKFEDGLRRAGWYPGRRTDTSHWADWLKSEGYGIHDAAVAFLAEYGGLKFLDSGPGISVYRERFSVDPCLVGGECEIIEGWSEELDKHIVPLGFVGQEMFEFGMDQDGRLYLFAHACKVLGRGEEGLKALVLGINGRIIG